MADSRLTPASPAPPVSQHLACPLLHAPYFTRCPLLHAHLHSRNSCFPSPLLPSIPQNLTCPSFSPNLSLLLPISFPVPDHRRSFPQTVPPTRVSSCLLNSA